MRKNNLKSIRWWPAVAILAITTVLLFWTGVGGEVHDAQNRFMKMASIIMLGVLLLIVWFALFSRIRSGVRWRGVGLIVGSIALFFMLFQYKGLDGNFNPIFEMRWGGTELARLQPTLGDNRNGAAKGENWLAETDYPQFLGPDRNADLSPKRPRISKDWTQSPPVLKWRQPIGEGWSAFAIVGKNAITQEQRDGREFVTNYELETGAVIWSHADSSHFESGIAGNGPRATPTIFADKVYTLGATGTLNCLDFATGREIWSRNVLSDYNAKLNEWGMSCSPLIVDSLVIVTAGGREGASLIACNRNTGETVWQSGDSPIGYASPVLTTLHGQSQILIFNAYNISSHQPDTGAELWSHPWDTRQPTTAQPVVLNDNRIFISSGYGTGAELFQVSKTESGVWQTARIWKSLTMKAKLTNVVHREGYIYGLDDGILACINIENGKRMWKRGRYGHGQLILLHDTLLIQAEKGYLALVAASPDEFKEQARFAALDTKTWNNPAISDNYVLVRNNREAACYTLAFESGE